nr:hypothetical protein [Arthrobacter sp.]
MNLQDLPVIPFIIFLIGMAAVMIARKNMKVEDHAKKWTYIYSWPDQS